MLQITNQAIRETSSTPKQDIGALAMTPDGRKFRYASMGGTASVPGKVFVKAALVANHQNRTPVTAVAGAKKITMDIGATALTADQYKDSYLVVREGTGAGHSYRIAGHGAADASASAVDIYLDEPLQVALDSTDSKVDLAYNPYAKLVIATTSIVSPVAGVPVSIIAADGYGWVQTGGPCAVLCQGTSAIGCNLSTSATTAGALVLASSLSAAVIAYAIETHVDGKYLLNNLVID